MKTSSSPNLDAIRRFRDEEAAAIRRLLSMTAIAETAGQAAARHRDRQIFNALTGRPIEPSDAAGVGAVRTPCRVL
jgi:hypothetical protein